MIDIEKRFSLDELDSIVKTIIPYINSKSTIALSGDMGTGKTTLVKKILSFFEVDPMEVSSPTYTICNLYSGKIKISEGQEKDISIYHYDLYRINTQSQQDIDATEIENNFGNSICIIEWSEKLSLVPENAIRISLEYINDESRMIKIKQT